MSVWAVIVAAGRGVRSGLSQNKVFFPIEGRSALSRCLDAFERADAFDGVVLVLSAADEARYREICDREGAHPLVRSIAHGGATRQESVWAGLEQLPEDCELVAIHDAARPFVAEDILRNTLESAQNTGSGVISTPITDALKRVSADGAVTSVSRDDYRCVQTPQAFRRREIVDAHRLARREGYTAMDDAELYERAYGGVTLVETASARQNRKLTMPEDFTMREPKELRIGSGYDAHRLKAGRALVLCGVTVPHEKGLDGHSDADVAVHALMDALL
ncbi:MAG: 2-C-methyl-D-erythritol 4-phosphate cytidylyltransferase, partial [Clostridia bacterium]|nr:2-C-methyl-D-erythritol 4-phosphate cytidylyltransferase [Clostridia bacterium]